MKKVLQLISAGFLQCVLIFLVLDAAAFMRPKPSGETPLSLEIGNSFESENYIHLNKTKESYPLVAVYIHGYKYPNTCINEIKVAVKNKKIKPSQVVFVFTAVGVGAEETDFLLKIRDKFADYPVYKTKETIYNYSAPTIAAYNVGNKLIWEEDKCQSKVLVQKIITHLKGDNSLDILRDSDLADVTDSAYRGKAVYTHPLSQLPDFGSLKSVTHTNVAAQPALVIYTFSGCKPCVSLAQKLEKECRKGTLDPKQIVFINLIDRVSPLLVHDIRNKYGISPYYMMIGSGEEVFPYPTIVAYNKEGEAEWTEYGYGSNTYKKIKKYMKK